MKDIVKQGNELIARIKKSMQKVEDCEMFADLLEKGTVGIANHNSITYLSTVLSAEQIEEIKTKTLGMIREAQNEAMGFLENLVPSEKKTPAKENPEFKKAVQSMVKGSEFEKAFADKKPQPKQPSIKAQIDFALVRRELESGTRCIDIQRKYYPDMKYKTFHRYLTVHGVLVQQSEQEPEQEPEEEYYEVDLEEYTGDKFPKEEATQA